MVKDNYTILEIEDDNYFSNLDQIKKDKENSLSYFFNVFWSNCL